MHGGGADRERRPRRRGAGRGRDGRVVGVAHLRQGVADRGPGRPGGVGGDASPGGQGQVGVADRGVITDTLPAGGVGHVDGVRGRVHPHPGRVAAHADGGGDGVGGPVDH